MPAGAQPVGGTIYEPNGSTTLKNAEVTLVNLNTGDRSKQDSDATDGSYTFELSDTDEFPSGYSDGDRLIVYGRKDIGGAGLAEYYGYSTRTLNTEGEPPSIDVTTALYTKKDLLPLPGGDKRDHDMMLFDPHTNAMRVINVDTDGVKTGTPFRRVSDTEWSIHLPNGTQFGQVDASGNLLIGGEFFALRTF